jgi:integrase
MDENIEMEMVRDILGHSSTNTTRMYAKRSSASMTNVLQFRGNLRTFKEQKNTPSESVTS